MHSGERDFAPGNVSPTRRGPEHELGSGERPRYPTEFPSLREVEIEHIKHAILRADGNKSKAARLLGISRVTLYRKLAEAGVVS